MVNAGDFVDVEPSFVRDAFFQFMVVSNGAYNGDLVWTSDPSANPDNSEHIRAYALLNTPYVVLGVEDMYGGGDGDFNDLVVLVDFGVTNVRNLVAYAAGDYKPPFAPTIPPTTAPPATTAATFATACTGADRTSVQGSGTWSSPARLAICARHAPGSSEPRITVQVWLTDANGIQRTDPQKGIKFSVVVLQRGNTNVRFATVTDSDGSTSGVSQAVVTVPVSATYDVYVYALSCSEFDARHGIVASAFTG